MIEIVFSNTSIADKGCDILKIEKINDNQIRCTLTSEDLKSRQLKLSELAYGSEKAKSFFRDMMLMAQEEYGFEADNAPLMIEAIPVSPESIILIITKVEDPEELDTRFSKFAPQSEESPSAPPETPNVTGADDILDLFQKLCESKLKSNKKKPGDTKDSEKKEAKAPTPMTPGQEKEASQEKVLDLTRIFTFPNLDAVIEASKGLNGFYDGQNTLYKTREQIYFLIVHQTGIVPEDFNKICNILSEYGSGKACSPSREAYLQEHEEVIIADRALQQLLLLA